MTSRPVLLFCLISLITILSMRVYAQTNIGHDPTRPAISVQQIGGDKQGGGDKKTIVAGYEVQSIIIGNARRLALVNNKFVSIGDTVGGAKVVAIDRNSVVLSESGRKLTIYLFDRNSWN